MESSCFDLINSEQFDHCGNDPPEDRLQDGRWVQDFLERWGFAEVEVDRVGLDRLIGLRTLLRRMVEAVSAGRPIEAVDLKAFNRVLMGSPSKRQLVCPDGSCFALTFVPVEKDWDWLLSEVAASLAELLQGHDPGRLRVCENPDCRWVFYDETKCRGRRYCGDTCGNLVKVRRFRERHKH